MATHPFKPDGSKLPLYLTVGGMITLGIVTTSLGFLMWSEPSHEPDESTEGMVLEGAPNGPGGGPGDAPGEETGAGPADGGPADAGPADGGPADAGPGRDP